MYGKDFQYASTRIVNTIVRIAASGDPVYVHSVDRANGLCQVTAIGKLNADNDFVGGADKQLMITLDELNVQPVSLGYVNFNANAFYLERMPIRHGPNNQGLNNENCNSTGPRLYGFPLKELVKCIKGDYPSFESAVKNTVAKKKTGNDKIIAFHRHWAVRGGVALLYKNLLLVGSINEGKPVLHKDYLYLKEKLESNL